MRTETHLSHCCYLQHQEECLAYSRALSKNLRIGCKLTWMIMMITMPIASLYAKHCLKFLTYTGIPNPLNKSHLQINDSVTDVETTCLRLQLIKSGFVFIHSRSKVPTNNHEAKFLQYFLPSKD